MDVGNHRPVINGKQVILGQLRAARSAQIQWRAYTQALAEGFPEHQARMPVVHARSRFNRWYWGASRQLASLSSFGEISRTHKSMLQIDQHILNLLFTERAPSPVMKWFRNPKTEKVRQLARAQRFLPKLVRRSTQLLANIEALENEIKNMTEKEIAALLRRRPAHGS